jgi:uncharacterized membrane protein YoaK (UPF0700 family)
LLFGVVLSLVGVLVTTQNGMEQLLIFEISPLRNAVHLLTGIAGLGVGFAAVGAYSREHNRYLGLVYLLVFVVGLVAVLANIGFLVELLGPNMADNVLHLATGVMLAGVGFGLTQ